MIIDGNAILHRAYHAMPPLTTSKGELVNAVFGFASILLRLFSDFKPTYAAVCFDRKAPTFRKEKFKGYQAKRPKMEDGLSGQIERVHEVVRALNIPIYELDGYEADDVIGTLVMQITGPLPLPHRQFSAVSNRSLKEDIIVAQGSLKKSSKIGEEAAALSQNLLARSTSALEIIVVTGDRDLLQLVNDRVKVYLPVKGLSVGVLLDEKGVEEKMGIKPGLIPDLKGLIGDQSDNYPGVPGVGPKTAVTLLQKYGSFQEIFVKLDQLDKFDKKTAEKLRRGREMGELSYELATIRRDVPVKLEIEKCDLLDYDWEKAAELFDELEFKSLIPRLPKKEAASVPMEYRDFGEAKEEKQLGLF